MRMVAAVQTPKDVLHPTSAGSKHCVLHPTSDTHTLSQCKRFLSMHERDRWLVIKDNKLCFVCFGEDHVSRSCKVESPCKNCNKRHHELLHLTGNDVKTRSSSHSVGMDSSPHPKPKANSSTKASKSQVLGVMDEGLFGQVALMILTAAPTIGPEDKVMFYASIDTGATQSLCSRQLAEQLFGEWKPTGKKEYFMFDSSKMLCEFVKGILNLAKNDGTVF